ncbi:MAG: hypothetical protein M3Y13_03110 [Armatimonadota bacterium]|nr:hypothetical protein [Armatimonadota bacterium]
MRSSRKILFSAVPLAVIGGLFLTRTDARLHAAEAPPAALAQTQKFVTYKFGTAQWLNPGHTIAAGEGVTFSQDDATLVTEAAVAQLDKDQYLVSAEAKSPVHLYDTQDDLTGLHGSIDFTKHLATLQGNIILRVTPGKHESDAPEGSPRRQFKDPATLTCAAMTYDYRRKIGKIPGPLTVHQVIQQKDGPLTRTLTADAGLYNGHAETILLVGTVKGTDSDGNVIFADTRASGKPVTIGIKEGAEYISVPFRTNGHFKVKPETDDGKDTGNGLDDLPPVPPAAPTPAAPTTAAPTASPSGSGNAPPAPAETGKH